MVDSHFDALSISTSGPIDAIKKNRFALQLTAQPLFELQENK